MSQKSTGSLWLSLIAITVGTGAVLFNVYLGFALTKDMAAASDQHLTVGLLGIGFLAVGVVGSVYSSKSLLNEAQKRKLLLGDSSGGSLSNLDQVRQKLVNLGISAVALMLLSLITGTISQTGRFPLVHGLVGFSVAGVCVFTIIAAINLASALKN